MSTPPAPPSPPAAAPPAVGAPAPPLRLPADDGGTFDLSEARGQPVVVYFYPKDDTPGCTAEACDFRDRHERFGAAGCQVVGVSPDAPGRHARFRAKHALPFRLLSDVDHVACAAWGAWGEKVFAGRRYHGVLRSTWLIGPDGVVLAGWPNTKVKGHVDAVLVALARWRAEEQGS